MSGMGTNVVTQIGIVVKDIEPSVERYCRVFGMEKPDIIITDTYDKAKTEYKGQATSAQAKLAFFPMGQVSIELIEPIGGPSTWREFLDTKGEGVHHIAFVVKDTDEVTTFLGEQGIEIDQQGQYTGGQYTYLGSEAALGVALELLENFSSEEG